jgi:TPR repeat protein
MIFFKKLKIKRLLKKIKSMQQQRVHSQPSTEALKKEIALYHRLSKIYLSLYGKKKYPFAREMAYECYRASAVIEDAESQYLISKALLDEAIWREGLQTEGVFANPNNERLIKQYYEEAHAYLNAAVALNHIKAKRALGLCYIKGLGVPADQDKGFEFVVSSIEQENSWDKVPQIFGEMGLNKPEYFSALMKKRIHNGSAS